MSLVPMANDCVGCGIVIKKDKKRSGHTFRFLLPIYSDTFKETGRYTYWFSTNRQL